MNSAPSAGERGSFKPIASRSADRRRVHQTTLVPEVVQPARQLECGVRADVALEDLAVVADRLDCPVGPVLVQSEQLAGVLAGPEDALDRGVGARLHLVDIRLRDAVLLGLK